MINDRQQQTRVDYETLKKMRRRQCRFLAYIVIVEILSTFILLKSYVVVHLGLKRASCIQYVIVNQKSCMLIWDSISCYL